MKNVDEPTKVRLKFKTSADSGKVVSYVMNVKGKLFGVPENNRRKSKMIVVPDPSITVGIVENALYNATLVKMKHKNGYIAKHIAPVVFEASVCLDVVPDRRYKVHVSIGSLKFTYSPLNKKKQRGVFLSCDEMLRFLQKRIDIQHPDLIIKSFMEAANHLEALLIDDEKR